MSGMEEIADDLQQVAGVEDPVKRKRNFLWAIALFGIYLGNADELRLAYAAFTGQPVSAPVVTESSEKLDKIGQSIDHIEKTIVAHIEHHPPGLGQTAINDDVVRKLEDLMDQINFNEFKSQKERDIIELQRKIDTANDRKDEIILERTRSEANGNLPEQLDSAYRGQIAFIDERVKGWREDIADKRCEISQAAGSWVDCDN